MFEELSEAEHDLVVVGCTDLDIEPLYAHDPERDLPLDTFWGMWAHGEVELELVQACERHCDTRSHVVSELVEEVRRMPET